MNESDIAFSQTPVSTETLSRPPKSTTLNNIFLVLVGLVLGASMVVGLIYLKPDIFKTLTGEGYDKNVNTSLDQDKENNSDKIADNLLSYTYNDNGLNFSFKYPKDFNIEEPGISWKDQTMQTLVSYNLELEPKLESSFEKLTISIEKNDSQLVDYVLTVDNEDTNLKEYKVGSFDVIEYRGFYKNAPAHSIAFKNNGYIYIVGVSDATKESEFNNETTLLKQIISSFEIK